MKWITRVAVLTLVAFAGCTKEPEEKKEGGLQIDWPGGSVKVGEGGVEVKAGDKVDVNVDTKNNGVDVKAPGVGVQVEDGKKVGVQAPGVDVEVGSGDSQDE